MPKQFKLLKLIGPPSIEYRLELIRVAKKSVLRSWLQLDVSLAKPNDF
jgi:hypothetical protein